jgi:8-oxo-dGTP pyrophosphatase MutT (NUDIX family)
MTSPFKETLIIQLSSMKIGKRRSARIIALDSANRLLLFKYTRKTGAPFWATPGGGLEAGESFQQAAAREAAEELGVAPVELSFLWTGTAEFHWDDRLIHQEERFFLLHLSEYSPTQSIRELHERENILEARWWTLDELRLSKELIYPEGLAAKLAPFIEHR